MNYLQGLEKFGIPPNFWCSEEYFKKAKLKQFQEGDTITVKDDEWDVFPSVDLTTGVLVWKGDNIWSDFDVQPHVQPPVNYEGKFLDYEYIYDPRQFITMEGSRLAVFRKNHRKFPRRFNGHLTYDWVKKYPWVPDLEGKLYELLSGWLEDLGESTVVHDSDIVEAYLTHGENRKILWDTKGHIYGVNIWDENWLNINFRYCFCNKKENFLSEYMRWLFYTDVAGQGKWVNDGGVLDNPKLKAFKDKLCPTKVREVRSWRKLNVQS